MDTTQLKAWHRGDSSLLQPDPVAQRILSAAHAHIAYATTVENKTRLPAYGLLSLRAQDISVQCYGLPALTEQFPKSFVDGSGTIFVSNDLVIQIALEEAATRGEAKGLELLIMLQQMRMLMNHHRRLKTLGDGTPVPEEIAQIAGETSAYCKLRMGFPEMQWVPCIADDIAASGAHESAIAEWSRQAEETIAQEIMSRLPDKRFGWSEEVNIQHGLYSLGMAPSLCAHRACRDVSVVLAAIAEQERFELYQASQPSQMTDRSLHPVQESYWQSTVTGGQAKPVDKRVRL